MPNYHAFGLNFSFPFEISRLRTISSAEVLDLTIDFINDAYDVPSVFFEVRQIQDVYLTINSVANFHIENGNKITIRPVPAVDQDTVLLFLFGSAFAVMLYQRDYLVLHGCTIEYQGACHCFVGPSGIRKSTLAASFMLQGFNVISDDVCSIQWIDNQPYVFPGFPDIKLWQPALDEYKISSYGLSPVRPQDSKYYIPIPRWQGHPVPLRSITQLNRGDAFHLKAENGSEKYQLILKNLYRPEFSSWMNLNKIHFTKISSLSSALSINTLTRPESGFRLEELSHFICDSIFNSFKRV